MTDGTGSCMGKKYKFLPPDQQINIPPKRLCCQLIGKCPKEAKRPLFSEDGEFTVVNNECHPHDVLFHAVVVLYHPGTLFLGFFLIRK